MKSAASIDQATLHMRRLMRRLYGSTAPLFLLRDPTITASSLHTWLQTPDNLTAFQALINSPKGLDLIYSSNVLVSAIAGSSIAMSQISNNERAIALLAKYPNVAMEMTKTSVGRSALVNSIYADLLPRIEAYYPDDIGSHSLITLQNGNLVSIGGHGFQGNTNVRNMVRILTNDNVWIATNNLPARRRVAAAILLQDGRILVAGGYDGSAYHSTCYIGTESSNTITWVSSTNLPSIRGDCGKVLLDDGRVLLIGGSDNSALLSTCVIGTVSGNSISWASATSIPVAKRAVSAVKLNDGRVLAIGGHNGSSGTSDCYIGTVSGTTITWVTATSLPSISYNQKAVVLPDGRVVVTGGLASSTKSECFVGTVSGNTITWQTHQMPSRIQIHDMDLRNGHIVIMGGTPANSWTETTNKTITGYYSEDSSTIHWRY